MRGNWWMALGALAVGGAVALAAAAVLSGDWQDRRGDVGARVVQVVAPDSAGQLQPTGAVAVVEDDGRGHFGFFPFGLFLWPVFIFGFIFVIGSLFRRGPGWPGPGLWSGRGEPIEDWHRRQHSAAATEQTSTPVDRDS